MAAGVDVGVGVGGTGVRVCASFHFRRLAPPAIAHRQPLSQTPQ